MSYVFWQGGTAICQTHHEVGTSKVDAGKTPSETRCSLVIAPKTLDQISEFSMALGCYWMFHPFWINISYYKYGKFCVAFFKELVSLGHRELKHVGPLYCIFLSHLGDPSSRPCTNKSMFLTKLCTMLGSLSGYQTQTNQHYQPRNYSLCISSMRPGRELLLQRIQPKENATTHN